MKKLLTFILVLVAVLSVSSIALAADAATINGTKGFLTLKAALEAAVDGDTINIAAGTHELDKEIVRITGKSLTLIGAGKEDTIIKSARYGFVIQNNPGGSVQFTIKDMTITSSNEDPTTFTYHPLYVKGKTTVDLENVTLHNAGKGTTAILVDSANGVGNPIVYEDDITATVNATNVTIDPNNTIEMLAKPCTSISETETLYSYAKFYFSDNCKNILEKNIVPQDNYNKGTDNLFANEKCINSSVAQIEDTKYTSLQAAIHAAQGMTGDVTIKLLADNAETVHILQKENLNLVIDGAKTADEKYKMTGQIKIFGDSRYTGAETLTIQNIAFEKASGDAIWGDGVDKKVAEGCAACDGKDMDYPHNVTIKDCTFTGNAIVGTRIRQGYKINIIDCVMNSGHSLVQNTNNKGITVKGTIIKNATEGGLNLFASTGVLVEGCDITAKDYGVRVDANDNGDAIIKDTKINAEQPVIIRYVKKSYTLTANPGNIFTVGDGKLPVNIIDGDAKKVNYTDHFVAMNGTTNTYYNSWDKAIADAKPGETVYPVENGDPKEDGAVTIPNPSTGGGYYFVGVRYNGGNSFSTDRSDVPVAVLIDGQPVGFTGNGSNFVVDCINPGASRITIVWNTIKVEAGFTPDANAYCAQAVIPKTGDMSIWAAVAAFFGF